MSERLELSPSAMRPSLLYPLITSLVIPRPIAWVSTCSALGVANLAPHSYFMVVASSPLHLAFSSTGVKDTLTNIRETGEFVINLVASRHAEAMNASSVTAPKDVDEFGLVGITAAPSQVLSPPRVADAPAAFECRLVHEQSFGDAHLVVGEVCHISLDQSMLTEAGIADAERLDPLCRLGGTGYARIGEVFHLARPTYTPGGAT